MQFSLETAAALATVLGTGISILALIQSRAWLVLISCLLVCFSLAIGWYARQKRVALNLASTVIEGHSIDSLNIANLRRRVNRTFVVQTTHHTVRIEGEDMEITWRYTGFCRTNHVSSMDFSIDSDEGTPFERLNCIAFDLRHDPEMTHPIRPVLLGTEGISKKVSVPFLETLKANEPFGILLKCTLPRCVKAGFGYYTSTSSFGQSRVQQCVIHLIFVGSTPKWMRVYESTGNGSSSKLLKTLPPTHSEPNLSEYRDVVNNRRGRSARVYTFWRDAV
jgi:hypothetical protein